MDFTSCLLVMLSSHSWYVSQVLQKYKVQVEQKTVAADPGSLHCGCPHAIFPPSITCRRIFLPSTYRPTVAHCTGTHSPALSSQRGRATTSGCCHVVEQSPQFGAGHLRRPSSLAAVERHSLQRQCRQARRWGSFRSPLHWTQVTGGSHWDGAGGGGGAVFGFDASSGGEAMYIYDVER